MALSNKHQDFINEYFLQKMNGTDAYMTVYPKASYDTARANAAKLLANTSIKAEIDRRLKEKQMSADEVLARLSDMARADISEFVDVSRPGDLADEKYKGKTHVIKKIKRKITRDQYGREFEEMELEFYDARQTLVDLGRYHKLFTDKIEITLRDELEKLLKDGTITPQDILNEFADAPEVAEGLFESIGLRAIEVSEAQAQSAEVE